MKPQKFKSFCEEEEEKNINTFYAFSFKVGHTFCLSIYGMSFRQNPHHKEPRGLENNHRIYRNKLVQLNVTI